MEYAIWTEDEFLKVDKLFDEGEYAECKRLLLYMLDEEPGFGKAHNLLAWLYYNELDDFEKAKRHFELAIKFSPTYPVTYINYAYMLNYLNRHKDLLAHAAKALQVEGVNKFIIHHEVGKSYELNGHYKKSGKAFKEALRFAINKNDVNLAQESVERIKLKTTSFAKKTKCSV